jgi:hypothetical protein
MAAPHVELDEVLSDLTTLLKNPDVTAALAEKKVNASLALVAVDALSAYVHGDRKRAHEDFATIAEEIEARAAFAAGAGDGGGEKPS